MQIYQNFFPFLTSAAGWGFFSYFFSSWFSAAQPFPFFYAAVLVADCVDVKGGGTNFYGFFISGSGFISSCFYYFFSTGLNEKAILEVYFF